ncbi:immunoglobulin-like domain-containing protein [Lacticaseibacillus saniviri]|uniref:immunoglobulin-like domain-containing protein n=1 Tax=Lacticaseibacillus saniviri TaxID=931533 RepID=UPI001EDE05AE|nr:SLAP domain-containing protein [Lacticaseibacillus saniviri]MCG4282486.1 DUF5011 domain-containing protein [Lacticaseibacillus saniviri]
MKKSSIKYLGVTAAALLAVAPIAAPAAVASIAPSQTVSAADATPAATNGFNTTQKDALQTALKSDFVDRTLNGTDAKAITVDSIKTFMSTAAPAGTRANAIDSTVWAAATNPFYKQVADVSAYKPAGTVGSGFTYTISGNGLSTNAGANEIAQNMTTAVQGNKDVTYTVTVNGYDLSKNEGAFVTTSFNLNFKASNSNTSNVATATFSPVTIKGGDAFPGNINYFNVASDIVNVKNAAGTAVSINTAKDIAALTYSANGVRPLDPSDTTATTDFNSAFSGFSDSASKTFKGNGVVYQVAKLDNTSTAVRDLVKSLTDAGQKPGYVNSSDLYYSDADQGTLYVVRPVTVQSANYNQETPKVTYQYLASPSAATVYSDKTTINLNTGDAQKLTPFDKETNDNGLKAATTAKQVADSINTMTNLSATDPKGATPTKAVTENDVVAAAKAAGITVDKFTPENGTEQDNTFITSGSFNVPVTFKGATGLTTTVYVPVKVPDSKGTVVENGPVVRYTNTVQNPTITVGTSFDPKADMIVYTDKNLSAQIDPSQWKIDGSVDTSKAGKYTLTYTFTNPAGVTSKETRVVTVNEKDGEQDATGTVYVNYVPGYGIAVWDTYKDGRKITGTKLQHGTAWKYYKTATINGEKWYNLGGDQWIQASYTSATKPGNAGSEIEKINGTVKVNYVPGYGIAIWGKPAADVTSKKLAHGTSWKVFAKTSVNGTTWYNLGGNQWVDGTYAKLQ